MSLHVLVTLDLGAGADRAALDEVRALAASAIGEPIGDERDDVPRLVALGHAPGRALLVFEHSGDDGEVARAEGESVAADLRRARPSLAAADVEVGPAAL